MSNMSTANLLTCNFKHRLYEDGYLSKLMYRNTQKLFYHLRFADECLKVEALEIFTILT